MVGYVGARWYDAGTGQFMSLDPKVASTLQPYQYVGNDPLNLTDPTGMCVKFFGSVCEAIHKVAHVADKVRHTVAAVNGDMT